MRGTTRRKDLSQYNTSVYQRRCYRLPGDGSPLDCHGQRRAFQRQSHDERTFFLPRDHQSTISLTTTRLWHPPTVAKFVTERAHTKCDTADVQLCNFWILRRMTNLNQQYPTKICWNCTSNNLPGPCNFGNCKNVWSHRKACSEQETNSIASRYTWLGKILERMGRPEIFRIRNILCLKL